MAKFILIGWFFGYWIVLFAGTLGILILGYLVIGKTSPELKMNDKDLVKERKAASEIVGFIFFTTLVVAIILIMKF